MGRGRLDRQTRSSAQRSKCAFFLGGRTLQRRLGELGLTYQELLDDVRNRAARRLLANTDLGIGEVAFLLGFEEMNSFTRAFQSWESTTPVKWRERAASSHQRGAASQKRDALPESIAARRR